MAAATYKINEDPKPWKQSEQLQNEFSRLSMDLQDWIRRANKFLPRRNQRFERSCNALSNKLNLVSELFFGLTVTGKLPKFHSAEESKW